MDSPRPAPVYLLAGGGGRRSAKDPLMEEAIGAAGVAHPRVAYVGAPSDDSIMFYRMIARMLRAGGAGRVDLVRLAGRTPDLAASRLLVEGADLVFITGGDVERGMELMDNTGMTLLLRKRHAEGVPFLGVSAGSIALAQRWIRWSDPDDDETATLFGCLGLAPILCDTHAEGDAWPELRALLGRTPAGTVGYGIPTSCALRVNAGLQPTALGGPVHRFRHDGADVRRIEDLAP